MVHRQTSDLALLVIVLNRHKIHYPSVHCPFTKGFAMALPSVPLQRVHPLSFYGGASVPLRRHSLSTVEDVWTSNGTVPSHESDMELCRNCHIHLAVVLLTPGFNLLWHASHFQVVSSPL